MSILGAMNTAVSGLTAQSAAFTNLSDNIANSQTVGYKSVTTSFADYLTSSTPAQNMSGAVETTPQYDNNLQGTITQSSDPLALAISGNGFFNVSETTGSSTTAFSPTQYYTRDGDFTQNKQGYLVNGAGEYLDGYNLNPTTGTLNTGNLQPIQIDTSSLPAVPTSNISYSAALPATLSPTAPATSDVQVTDSAGASHQLGLTWSQNPGANSYNVSFSSPDIGGGASLGNATVTFNSNGTLASVTGDGGFATGGSTTSGQAAALTISPPFNGAAQPISINLGTIGSTNGVSMTSGTGALVAGTTTANGQPVGNYTGIAMTSSGDVVASYDNSQTRVVAHVPLATFSAPDGLQRQNGQAFTASGNSGVPVLGNANQGGTGQLVTGSVESSNVDISTNLTSLITAQQAYGANAKVVTTANTLMQTTLQMIQ